MHYGDLTDFEVLILISKIKPDEIYNLAANHVAVSFENPEYTSNVNALGALRILESIFQNKLFKTKFYQASLLNYLVIHYLSSKMKKHLFIPNLLMGHQNYLHIG